MFSDLFPIDWNAFHFVRPQFLWLIIPALLLPIAGLMTIRQEVRWKNIIAPHLRQFVIRKGNDRLKMLMNMVLFAAIGFGVLAVAGPTWKKVEVSGQKLETPMVILLDLSQSMMAGDLQPNRLERAKFKITDLLNHNPQARTALIGFTGTAHTIVPLTKDYDIILSHIEGLKPSVMPFPGSNLENAITLADTIMAVTEAPGTLLILSDDFENGHVDLLQRFTQKTDNNIILLPMNTRHGSEVPAESETGSMKDQNGNTVFSSLNEEVLTRLAIIDKISVQYLTIDDSDVELISKTIRQNLTFETDPGEEDDDWRDVGPVFMIPMALLLLFWFRKGWVIYLFPLFLFTSCSGDSDFADLWFTKDYQGQQMLDKGQYAKAALNFRDPLQKGVAWFKAGNFEEAIEAFKQDTTAIGAYNLGLAYFSNGDTAAAIFAFGEAAELDPELTTANDAIKQLGQLKDGTDEINPEDAREVQPQQAEENIENQDMEDLGGGGQEATEEDMKKERKEETVTTDISKGKESEEIPDDLGSTIQQQGNSKVLMRRVDDDPSRFLQRKFEFQVKEKNLKPKSDEKKW
jgi:Ca-activated chloride channel family protein